MLLNLINQSVKYLEWIKLKLEKLRSKVIMRNLANDAPFRKLRLKSISNSLRCDICHQSDQYHPDTDICNRCKGITNTNYIQTNEYRDHDIKSATKNIVNHEDGIADTIQAMTSDNYDSKVYITRINNLNRIKLEINTRITQLGIRLNKTISKQNYILGVCLDIVKQFEKDYLKDDFLLLDDDDWLVLDTLFDPNYKTNLLDMRHINTKANNYKNDVLPYSNANNTSYTKVLSIQDLSKSLDLLVFNYKAVNLYNESTYDTIYGTAGLFSVKQSYYIINDYGIKLVLLKNAILELDPWFFQSLYDSKKVNIEVS